VPPLDDRLDQLERLSQEFGPETIAWRFDPICFFRTGQGRVENNLGDFTRIAQGAGQWDIKRCITSFVDDYSKIRTRLDRLRRAGLPSMELVDPGMEKRREVLLRMEKVLDTSGIRLYTCCERSLFATLPETSGIGRAPAFPEIFWLSFSAAARSGPGISASGSNRGAAAPKALTSAPTGFIPASTTASFAMRIPPWTESYKYDANPAMDRELQRK